MRRLGYNKLGPEGGMALAEALKRNTHLKKLKSAALCSNPHPPMHSLMLTCIPIPSLVLRYLSTTHPTRPHLATSHFPTRALD